MKLNPEQQKIVESLITSANKLANKFCPGDEEAYSVAYLALCEAVTRYTNGPATIQTYCLVYARGALRDYKRKKYHLRKKNKPVILPLKYDPPIADTGIEDFEVQDLLSVLPPSDREIFTRRYWSNESIASLMKYRGCCRSTVYNILNRCKERLRREIDGEPRSDTSGRL